VGVRISDSNCRLALWLDANRKSAIDNLQSADSADGVMDLPADAPGRAHRRGCAELLLRHNAFLRSHPAVSELLLTKNHLWRGFSAESKRVLTQAKLIERTRFADYWLGLCSSLEADLFTRASWRLVQFMRTNISSHADNTVHVGMSDNGACLNCRQTTREVRMSSGVPFTQIYALGRAPARSASISSASRALYRARCWRLRRLSAQFDEQQSES
jgi:hypothetical protein